MEIDWVTILYLSLNYHTTIYNMVPLIVDVVNSVLTIFLLVVRDTALAGDTNSKISVEILSVCSRCQNMTFIVNHLGSCYYLLRSFPFVILEYLLVCPLGISCSSCNFQNFGFVFSPSIACTAERRISGHLIAVLL